ncbi:MAG: PQQ-binding-like beta-propeller repeat protein, partial [Candidatus Diapherotrites archaeon]|nr:PQQ-binding-like beta-propeller repeat protein [Candidatus Diapherotrites archaeon]
TIYFEILGSGDLPEGGTTVPDGGTGTSGFSGSGTSGGAGGVVPPIVSGAVTITLTGGGTGGAAGYSPGTPEWSSFHGNETNSGRSNTSYTNVSDVNERWAFTAISGPILSSPVIASNVFVSDGSTKTLIFIGADDGNLYALNADTLAGSPVVWSTPTGGAIRSTPAYLPGIDVKDTSTSGTLVSGNQSYGFVESGMAGALGTTIKDVVVVGSSDGSVYGIDASNGSVIWRQLILGAMPLVASSTPFTIILGDGTAHNLVFTGSDTGRATAIDVSNGAIWWARTLKQLGGNAGNKATPAVSFMPWIWKAMPGSGDVAGGLNFDADAVIGGGPAGSIGGNGTATMEEEMFDIDGDGIPDPAQKWTNVDTAFYADSAGYVTAIDTWTGDILWRNTPSGIGGGTNFVASPVLMNIAISYVHPNLGNVTTSKVIVVADTSSGNVYVVDAHNGYTIGSLATVQGISATPAVSGTNIFIATDDGKMYKTNVATAASGLTSTPAAMGESQTKVSSPTLVNGGNDILVATCYSKAMLALGETHDGELWKYNIAGNSWTKIYNELGANGSCSTYDWISSIAATDDILFVGTTGGSPGEVIGLGEGISLPDLVTSITGVSSTTVISGNSFDVNCTTTNNGPGDAATSTTSVYLGGGTPSDENPTGALSAGSTTNGTANNFTIDTTGLAIGNYNLRCEADLDDDVVEGNEVNNIATHGTQITINPAVNPPTVAITTPLAAAIVSGTIAITGTATPNLITSSAISSVEVKIGDGSWAAAVGTNNWSYSWNTTTSANGAVTINARATDAAASIGSATPVSVTVSNGTAGKPDLAITASDISVTPSGPYSVGQSVTISATVNNLGLGSVSLGTSPTVHFYQGNPASGGTLIGTKTLGALAALGIAGSSQTVSVQWTIPAAGSFDIYVIVDKDNLIDETVN